MEIIYNYLKIAFLDIKTESKQNLSFVGFLLVLVTVPASYGLNNIALIILGIFVLIKFKKENIGFSKSLILPVLLYVLMLFSFFWTISDKLTLKALPKEIPLLLIPLFFYFGLNFTANQKAKILKYYSHGIVFYTIYWIFKAVFRYILTHDASVFFYHELVTKDVNAIHTSVYVAISFFYFFTKKSKDLISNLFSFWLFIFILLLSSKNIIIVIVLLIIAYLLFYSGLTKKAKTYYITLFLIAFISILSIGKIRDRFEIEIAKNFSYSPENIIKEPAGINTINIAEAWKKEQFHPSDFFPGTALRVYKFRMFIELFKEEPVFWKGYGLNASKIKLMEKEKKYNLHSGYGGFNFHNQYVQNFAELGFFGFLLLLAIVILNLKNSIKSKDFLHIAFSILMISLFLTESFLWRQRGVMFFTLMYCIFNAKEHVNLSKTE